MRLVSPMERGRNSKHYDDDDEGKYQSYAADNLNPNLRPCGGTKPGKIHFTAEMESKAFAKSRYTTSVLAPSSRMPRIRSN